MKDAAIADPETGSSSGNVLTAMHSGSSTVVPRKYDKLEYGIWNQYSFTFMIELTSVVISRDI
jgi:hypothetical protein